VNNSEPKEYKKVTGESEEELDLQRTKTNPLVVLKGLIFGHAGEIPFTAFNRSCVGIQTDESFTTRFVIKSKKQ